MVPLEVVDGLTKCGRQSHRRWQMVPQEVADDVTKGHQMVLCEVTDFPMGGRIWTQEVIDDIVENNALEHSESLMNKCKTIFCQPFLFTK